MTQKWPKTMPILTARDFCRNDFDMGKKHCLSGWARAVFGYEGGDWAANSDKRFNKLTEAIVQEIDTVTREDDSGIAEFNDDKTNPKELLARVWNRAIKRLGYIRTVYVND